MGIIDRIIRAFDSFSNLGPDEIIKYGMEGERMGIKALEQDGIHCFCNKLLPHPKKEGWFLEMDVIIYANGNIYCIDFKNMKGTITYSKKYEVQPVKKKILFGIKEIVVEEPVFVGYDKDMITQHKDGKYGEEVPEKHYSNPIKKVKYYIYHLKEFLSAKNDRLKTRFIYPIVAFTNNNCDISAIHTIENNEYIIYASEIDQIINSHKNGKEYEPFVIDSITNLRTWDNIWNRKNERIYGILISNKLSIIDDHGNNASLDISNVRNIDITRDGLLSDADHMIVTYKDGKIFECKNFNGEICIDVFGNKQVHKLRNLNRILTGTTQTG